MMSESSRSGKQHFNKRKFMKQKFKRNFGSQNEGHGQALLQKKAALAHHFKKLKNKGQQNYGKYGENFRDVEARFEGVSDETIRDFPWEISEKERKTGRSDESQFRHKRSHKYKKITASDQECVDAIASNTGESHDASHSSSYRRPKSKYKQAELQYQAITEAKKKKREEAQKRRQEIEEARKKYQEKKLRRTKLLSQRTKKGQPVMRARMELLLDEIESELGLK